MKRLRTVPRFEKDLRLAHRRGFDISRLQAGIDLLRAGRALPASYKDHPLKGQWSGYRECHVAPDWLLIYRDAGDMIVLERTGTHSDLF
jgi:mRNA interferase YafQ